MCREDKKTTFIYIILDKSMIFEFCDKKTCLIFTSQKNVLLKNTALGCKMRNILLLSKLVFISHLIGFQDQIQSLALFLIRNLIGFNIVGDFQLYKIMFGIFLISAVILLVTYLLYTWMIKPKRQMTRLAKQFKQAGYRVLTLPYQPLGITFYDQLTEDETKKNDAFYTHKNLYPQVDVLVCNVLNQASIVIMNIDILKDVMSGEKVMILHKEKKLGEVFWYVFNRGIIGIQGKQWKHRRVMISKLLNYDFITSHIPMMSNIADQLFDKFQAQSRINHPDLKNGFKGDIYHELMLKFTSSVMMSGFLGLDSLKEQRDDLNITESVLQLFKLSADALQDPLLLIFGEKLLKKRWRKADRNLLDLWGNLNKVLQEIINQYEEKTTEEEESEEKKNVKSLIELLLVERNKQGSEYSFNNQELIDEIKTFVIAASDTTANYLTAILFYCFQKPYIVKKLKEEINQVIKSDQDITPENFKKMPYLECVLSEAARIFNPATNFFQRETSQDTTLGGVPINKGLLIDIIYFNNNFDPKTFENPHEFIPERWEGETSKEKQFLTSMIFSGGPRSCIGRSLALINTKVMMIKFLQRYGGLVEEGRMDDKERGFEFKLIYHIKDTKVTLFPEN